MAKRADFIKQTMTDMVEGHREVRCVGMEYQSNVLDIDQYTWIKLERDTRDPNAIKVFGYCSATTWKEWRHIGYVDKTVLFRPQHPEYIEDEQLDTEIYITGSWSTDNLWVFTYCVCGKCSPKWHEFGPGREPVSTCGRESR